MHDLQDVVEQFKTFLLTERRVAKNTFLAYVRDLEQFELFLGGAKIGFSLIQKKHLSSFLKSLKDQGLNAKSLSRKISTLRLFFKYLNEQHHIPNVAKNLVFPKIDQNLPTYLTQAEIEQLLLAANKDLSPKGVRNKVMLYLLYATGVRVTELVTMTVDQVLFDTGFVKIVGKGSKERHIPLPRNILELLRYYLDHIYPTLLPEKNDHTQVKKKYLFAALYNHRVKPLSRQSLWLSLRKILQEAGITKEISPHSLRHSLATHLLQQGADLRSLQMLLGHQNLSTVQIYTHLGDSQIRKIYDKKHPRATE